MTLRTTIRLPKDLLRCAKRKAAAEGRTLTALIEEGLRTVTHESPARKPVLPNAPPISSATGGLMPGVDITSFSKLQELDDIEHLDRINRNP